MAARNSKSTDAVEDVVGDKPAEGGSVEEVADSGLSPDPAVTEAVSDALDELGLDPAEVDAERINTNVGHPTVDLGDTARSSVRVEDLASYPPLQQHILDNYRQLKAERDWSWEDVAAHVEHADPRLAAYFRAAADQLDAAPRSASAGSFETR